MTALCRPKNRECAIKRVVSDDSWYSSVGGWSIPSKYLSILPSVRQARSCRAEKGTEAENGPHLVIWNKISTVSSTKLHSQLATQFEKRKPFSSCFSPSLPAKVFCTCTSPKLELLHGPKLVQRKSHNSHCWAVRHGAETAELRRSSLRY